MVDKGRLIEEGRQIEEDGKYQVIFHLFSWVNSFFRRLRSAIPEFQTNQGVSLDNWDNMDKWMDDQVERAWHKCLDDQTKWAMKELVDAGRLIEKDGKYRLSAAERQRRLHRRETGFSEMQTGFSEMLTGFLESRSAIPEFQRNQGVSLDNWDNMDKWMDDRVERALDKCLEDQIKWAMKELVDAGRLIEEDGKYRLNAAERQRRLHRRQTGFSEMQSGFSEMLTGLIESLSGEREPDAPRKPVVYINM